MRSRAVALALARLALIASIASAVTARPLDAPIPARASSSSSSFVVNPLVEVVSTVRARDAETATTVDGRRVRGSTDARELALCACAFTTSANGLTCAREGAIIAGFEASGEYAGRDGDDAGLVPLSRAICCVPCVDERGEPEGVKVRDVFPGVTGDEDGEVEARALRAMSVDCVPAKAPRGDRGGAMCPQGTFLQGFERVNRASGTRGGTFNYPKDVGECCKVKFVLPSGNALGVDACECAAEDGVDASCGQTNSPDAVAANGAVVTGFESVISAMGALGSPMLVPATPLRCCKTCVRDDATPQPLDDGCSHLNRCNGHGECVIDGHCECHVGWTGDDCGEVDEGSDGIYGQSWQYAVMLSGVLLGCCARAILCRHVEQMNIIRAQRLMMQEPLMRRREENTVMDEWEEASDLSTSEENLDSDDEEGNGEGSLVDPVAARSDDDDDDDANTGEIPLASSVEVSEDDAGEDDEETAGAAKKASKRRSGVPGSECVVCMTAPVQCVLIPCGHACMCRGCSRRMRRCPICRIVVDRRQKLYMGA